MTKHDPWALQRWAFGTVTGSSTRKALLSMIAMMADAQTGRCEAKQDTLCTGVEAGERAVRDHLKALVEAGLIARRAQFRKDGSRRGDEYLLLAPWVTEWPDGEPLPDHRQNPPEAESTGGADRYPPRGIEPAGQEQPLEERPLTTPLPLASEGNARKRRDTIRPMPPGPKWDAFVGELGTRVTADMMELYLDDLRLLGLDDSDRAVIAGRACWHPGQFAGVIGDAATAAGFEARLATTREVESADGHRP
jgi:hypothetical protein